MKKIKLLLKFLVNVGLFVPSKLGIVRKEKDIESNGGKWHRQTKRHIELIKFINDADISLNAKILDVGCGKGWLINRLRENGFNNIQGCDWIEKIDNSEFEYTRLDLNSAGLRFYPDQTFDVVISSDVLEHMENPASILREMARVLKPEGHIFITIPNCANIYERLLFFLTGNSGRYRPQKNEWGHISYLPSHVIAELFNRANLRLINAGGGGILFSLVIFGGI